MGNPAVIDKTAEQRILEAAQSIFLQKGFAGARMQEIADEAGINKALLHYYFRSKDKLFEVIFREAFGQLMPVISDIFMQPVSLFEKIEQFTASYISIVEKHPYVPAFVLSEINRNPDEFFNQYVPKEMIGKMKVVVEQMAAAAAKGEIRPIDPRQLMINIMALSVFPFAARPMLQRMMRITDPQYNQLLDARKKEVSQFIIHAITPAK